MKKLNLSCVYCWQETLTVDVDYTSATSGDIVCGYCGAHWDKDGYFIRGPVEE